jgi:hypothetical protein
MKAKKKPLEKKTLADFGISADKRLKVLKVTGELRTCGAQLICRGELLTWAVMQNPLRGKAAARWRTWMGSFPSSKSSALSRGLYANELSIYLANRLAAWCIVYTVLSKSVKVPCHMRPPHGPLIDVQH